jgi:hypothetical protein
MFIARPQSALLQGPAHAPPSCPALAALRRQPCQITTHQRSMWAPRHWPQPGGHGGLQILPNGSMKWGVGNFLIRTRQLFAERGLMVAVVDAPSDRQSPPYLGGFRQTPEHAADLKAVIARLRQNAKAPVRLVGTSRETQSAARASGLFLWRHGSEPQWGSRSGFESPRREPWAGRIQPSPPEQGLDPTARPQAACSSKRTSRPIAVAMLTNASREKRDTRPRRRSFMRGWVTPQR